MTRIQGPIAIKPRRSYTKLLEMHADCLVSILTNMRTAQISMNMKLSGNIDDQVMVLNCSVFFLQAKRTKPEG